MNWYGIPYALGFQLLLLLCFQQVLLLSCLINRLVYHLKLAKNVRPLDILPGMYPVHPAYPSATKVQIEQKALPRGEFQYHRQPFYRVVSLSNRQLIVEEQLRWHSAVITTQLRMLQPCTLAGIAQLVERNLAKVEVASSNLVSRSSCFVNSYSERTCLEATIISLILLFSIRTSNDSLATTSLPSMVSVTL